MKSTAEDILVRLDDAGGVVMTAFGNSISLFTPAVAQAKPKALTSKQVDAVFASAFSTPGAVAEALPEGIVPVGKVKAVLADEERPFAFYIAQKLVFRSRHLESQRLSALLDKGCPPSFVAIVDERDGTVYGIQVL